MKEQVTDIQKRVKDIEEKLVYVCATPEERKYLNIDGSINYDAINETCERILDLFGYEFIDNHLGSNINSGLASSLIEGATLTGKQKKDLAVFEIDERSANKVYPYLTPNYLICTNIFRDSLMRNGHTEFIADILVILISII